MPRQGAQTTWLTWWAFIYSLPVPEAGVRDPRAVVPPVLSPRCADSHLPPCPHVVVPLHVSVSSSPLPLRTPVIGLSPPLTPF